MTESECKLREIRVSQIYQHLFKIHALIWITMSS